jgi:hypothetical protein
MKRSDANKMATQTLRAPKRLVHQQPVVVEAKRGSTIPRAETRRNQMEMEDEGHEGRPRPHCG